MSEAPTLRQLVETAGEAPLGISPSTQVIAETEPRVLMQAMRDTEISVFITRTAVEQAVELDEITYNLVSRIANQDWDDDLRRKYELLGETLQDLASTFQKDGIVPPASVLNGIFAAQEEAESDFPRESLEDARSKEEALEERDEELNEDMRLVRQIIHKRTLLARGRHAGRRAVAIGLTSLTLGGAFGGLTYYSKQEIRDSFKESNGNTPTRTQYATEDLPDLPDSGTRLMAGIGALGGLIISTLYTGGEGFTGRVAHRRAKRMVAKNQAGKTHRLL